MMYNLLTILLTIVASQDDKEKSVAAVDKNVTFKINISNAGSAEKLQQGLNYLSNNNRHQQENKPTEASALLTVTLPENTPCIFCKRDVSNVSYREEVNPSKENPPQANSRSAVPVQNEEGKVHIHHVNCSNPENLSTPQGMASPPSATFKMPIEQLKEYSGAITGAGNPVSHGATTGAGNPVNHGATTGAGNPASHGATTGAGNPASHGATTGAGSQVNHGSTTGFSAGSSGSTTGSSTGSSGSTTGSSTRSSGAIAEAGPTDQKEKAGSKSESVKSTETDKKKEDEKKKKDEDEKKKKEEEKKKSSAGTALSIFGMITAMTLCIVCV